MPADETTTTRERLRAAVRSAPDQWRVWWRVALLGVTTIVSYGFVLYSFGVFVVPIEEETGWGTGVVSAAFSLSLLGGGLGAIFAGRVLDKVGARPVMLVSLAAGSVLLLVAASAESSTAFIVAWGLGGGIISAGLFYNVTMAITARLFMDRRAQAFAVLTFIGGLASPIYFPLAGVLVDATGWRDTVRIMVVVLVIGTVPTAMLVRGAAATLANAVEGGPEAGYSSVRQAFRTREVVQMVAMFSLAMSAFSALQVYHVPAMQAAGVSLTAATTIAGVRGFLSLPGRALLSPITTRAGVPRAMLVMYAAMALGVGILILAGSTVFIWTFAVITGLAFGTIAPLHGLHAAAVFGERRIGTLMGAQTAVVAVASAAGPLLVGLTVDATDGYGVALAIIAIMFGLSLGLLVVRPRRTEVREVAVETPPPGTEQ
ncbi:MAG: MFS transporter, partial [Chloroflexi bacterium]|nr:MFS transporter [Chloroflexota bacterium]